MSSKNLPKAARDNRANQLNPNHRAYHGSRGKGGAGKPLPKAARDNRANQLNPNHRAYHSSRGKGSGRKG